MNAEVKAVTAEDYEAECSQATEVSHITPIVVLRTRLRCVAKEEICAHDQHGRVRKTYRQGS